MAECSKCGDQAMTFTCRYCGEKFCAEHRLPENHDCEKIDEVKKNSGEDNSDKWFKQKEPKRETVHGRPKQSSVRKPSLSGDLINTLKKNYTLAIIAVTIVSFALQYILSGYMDFITLSPALTEAAITATNEAVRQLNIGYPDPFLVKTFVESPWTVFTVMLAHSGTFHIFANMVTFYFFGTTLERSISGKELLKFYIGAGLIASIGYIAFRNILFYAHGPLIGGFPTLGPAVGASGAVVAVFAAVAMLYPDAEVLLYFFIPMKIKTALKLFAGIELFNLGAKIAGMTLPLIGGFASSAHLAGLAVGVWYGRKLQKRFSNNRKTLDLLGY